jgi:hypothetical protein
MGEIDLAIPELALSVRQPWAWAIVSGFKDVENRTVFSVQKGNLDRRGRFAIHASKGMTREEYVDAYDLMRSLDIVCPPPAALPRGGIVGHVEIAGCVKKSDSPWFFGPRGLVLRNAIRLGAPIPSVGALGFFRWQPSGGEMDAPAKWMRARGDAPMPASGGAKAAGPDLFSKGDDR